MTTGTNPLSQPTRAVAIATMAQALRQAGNDLGNPPNDTLVSLMLAQMLGAEGSMPGLWDGAGYTLRGTNNIGAAQVPGMADGQAFMAAHNTPGWGAFGHKDSNPGGDDYIGWYFMAPSVYESAKHWLTSYGGTKAVLSQSPQSASDYAAIMYQNGYFTGLTTDSETEIQNYANAMSNALPEALDNMNGPANDPTALSVDPTMFDTLDARKITEDLYNKAMSGGTGSAWAFLLPAQWSDLQASNGVVWFSGSAPGAPGGRVGAIVGKLGWPAVGAVAGGLLAGPFWPVGAAAGAAVVTGVRWLWGKHEANVAAANQPPDPKAVQTQLNALGMANPPLVVDGNIGPLSQAAIMAFQTSQNLPATGQLDPATVKALGV